MTPAEHRAAAEENLTAAWAADDSRPLLRAIVHALLALAPEPEDQ